KATRVGRPPDTPLSAIGRGQAERIGARLAGAGVGRILSSDLPRAVETAEAIARHTGAPLGFDAELQERNYGAIRGTPYAELREDIFGPDYEPPEGERWDIFHARVDRAWARVAGTAGDGPGALVVVTHGLVCWSILSRHVTGGGEPVTSMRFGNTSLTILDGPAPWRAALVDCTAHLEGMDGRAGTRV